MSAKTKIVVVHMKELVLAGIFTALGILFIIVFLSLFFSDKGDEAQTAGKEPSSSVDVSSDSIYLPGLYTTELILGGNTVAVELIVDEKEISSVRLVNLSDSVTTMYPLLQPAFDSISGQLRKTQSLEEITYTTDSKYTSLVLLEAIRSSLEKAKRTQ